MKMMKEDLEAIIGRIRERKPYVEIYYRQFGYKPQWLQTSRGEYKKELVDFETWLVCYKREERINKLLGE